MTRTAASTIAKRELAGAKAAAIEDKRQLLRTEWATVGASLTWEEAVAGVACRGCGVEVMGDARWRGHVLGGASAEYNRITAAEASRFAAAHPDCSGNSISSTTSVVRHCFDCCPPLPMQSGSIDMDLLGAKLSREVQS